MDNTWNSTAQLWIPLRQSTFIVSVLTEIEVSYWHFLFLIRNLS